VRCVAALLTAAAPGASGASSVGVLLHACADGPGIRVGLPTDGGGGGGSATVPPPPPPPSSASGGAARSSSPGPRYAFPGRGPALVGAVRTVDAPPCASIRRVCSWHANSRSSKRHTAAPAPEGARARADGRRSQTEPRADAHWRRRQQHAAMPGALLLRQHHRRASIKGRATSVFKLQTTFWHVIHATVSQDARRCHV
jgi:hypothetical protein